MLNLQLCTGLNETRNISAFLKCDKRTDDLTGTFVKRLNCYQNSYFRLRMVSDLSHQFCPNQPQIFVEGSQIIPVVVEQDVNRIAPALQKNIVKSVKRRYNSSQSFFSNVASFVWSICLWRNLYG